MKKDINEVEEDKVDILAENKLVMETLKTRDLPKMIKIVKKLNLKEVLKDAIDTMFNMDVDPDTYEKIKAVRTKMDEDAKGKNEEEKKVLEEEMLATQRDILQSVQGEETAKIFVTFVDNIIENYDVAYAEVNDFIGGLYGISKKEVEELDLDVFMECFYNLRKQDKLINFFKTALK